MKGRGGPPLGGELTLWLVCFIVGVGLAAMVGSAFNLRGGTIFLIFVFTIGLRVAASIYDEHQKHKK